MATSIKGVDMKRIELQTTLEGWLDALDPRVCVDRTCIIKAQHIGEIVGLRSGAVRRLEDRGKFPRRIDLGNRQFGYFAADVYLWLESRRVPVAINAVSSRLAGGLSTRCS